MDGVNTIARPRAVAPSAAGTGEGCQHRTAPRERQSSLDHALAWLAVAGIAALTAAVAYGLGEALWAVGVRI